MINKSYRPYEMNEEHLCILREGVDHVRVPGNQSLLCSDMPSRSFHLRRRENWDCYMYMNLCVYAPTKKNDVRYTLHKIMITIRRRITKSEGSKTIMM